jgi:hypothetical protein
MRPRLERISEVRFPNSEERDDGAAHAVPEEKERLISVTQLHVREGRLKVGEVFIERADERAAAGRPAVATQVERLDGVATLDERRTDVAVAAAVLA